MIEWVLANKTLEAFEEIKKLMNSLISGLRFHIDIASIDLATWLEQVFPNEVADSEMLINKYTEALGYHSTEQPDTIGIARLHIVTHDVEKYLQDC